MQKCAEIIVHCIKVYTCAYTIRIYTIQFQGENVLQTITEILIENI